MMSYQDGWRLFDSDLNKLLDAIKRNYVLCRMAVSQRGAGANMSVDVESGDCLADETYVTKVSTTNVAITAADATNPRKDIIVVDSAGTVSAVAGAAEAADPEGSSGPSAKRPKPPNIPANKIILAEVWVAAGATAIYNANITDRRMLAAQKFPWNMGPLRDYSRFLTGSVMMKGGYLTSRYAKYQRIETGLGTGRTYTRQSTTTDLLRRGYGTYQFKYYHSGWEAGKQFCVGFFWGASCTLGGAYFYEDKTGAEKVNTAWNASTTTTAITWDPTTEATLKIEWTSTQVKFYVGGGLQATHATNIPQEELPLGWEIEVDFKDTDYANDAYSYFKDWERIT